jgi:hypothetical protein
MMLDMENGVFAGGGSGGHAGTGARDDTSAREVPHCGTRVRAATPAQARRAACSSAASVAQCEALFKSKSPHDRNLQFCHSAFLSRSYGTISTSLAAHRWCTILTT